MIVCRSLSVKPALSCNFSPYHCFSNCVCIVGRVCGFQRVLRTFRAIIQHSSSSQDSLFTECFSMTAQSSLPYPPGLEEMSLDHTEQGLRRQATPSTVFDMVGKI
jgi:hypothetical protein